MFLVVIIFAYFLGLVFYSILFGKTLLVPKAYAKYFIIFTVIIVIYHSLSLIFDFSATDIFPGAYYDDDYSYYLFAKDLVSAGNFWDTSIKANQAFTWIVLNTLVYKIFGPNILFSKLLNAAFMALDAILIYHLGLIIFKNKKIANYSKLLFMSFIPLVFASFTALKEVFLSFLVLSNIFLFIKFMLSINTRLLVLKMIIFLILLFLTRYPFAILFFVSFLAVFIIRSRIPRISKILSFIIIFFALYAFYNSDFLRTLRISQEIETDINQRGIQIGRGEKITAGGGYFEYAKTLFKEPGLFLNNIFVYFVSYFLTPPPTSILKAKLSVHPRHFWASLYSPILYLLLPCLLFGVYYRIKFKKWTKTESIIYIFLFLVLIGIALNGNDPHRYKTSVFPLIMFEAAYGIYYFRL